MHYSEAIHRASLILNIEESTVLKVYRFYFSFIREHIKNLPFKEDLTEEEFSKLITNFNIPGLGKLKCTYKRYIGVKKKYNRNYGKKNFKKD